MKEIKTWKYQKKDEQEIEQEIIHEETIEIMEKLLGTSTKMNFEMAEMLEETDETVEGYKKMADVSLENGKLKEKIESMTVAFKQEQTEYRTKDREWKERQDKKEEEWLQQNQKHEERMAVVEMVLEDYGLKMKWTEEGLYVSELLGVEDNVSIEDDDTSWDEIEE